MGIKDDLEAKAQQLLGTTMTVAGAVAGNETVQQVAGQAQAAAAKGIGMAKGVTDVVTDRLTGKN